MGNCIEVITEKDYGREASIITKSKDDGFQEFTTFPICQKPFCERMEEMELIVLLKLLLLSATVLCTSELILFVCNATLT